MIGVPERNEAAPYYFTYIDRISSGNIVGVLESQLNDTLPFWLVISEEKSLHRYAPEKWSIRQVLNHVNDCERVFLFRALWFARGLDSPLPSYDELRTIQTFAAEDHLTSPLLEELRLSLPVIFKP